MNMTKIMRMVMRMKMRTRMKMRMKIKMLTIRKRVNLTKILRKNKRKIKYLPKESLPKRIKTMRRTIMMMKMLAIWK